MSAAVHSLSPKADADARLGSLEVRLARTAEDIDNAQALRYQVFYQEMGAKPTAEMEKLERDFDSHDSFCDHLLLLDHARKDKNSVIGTYRLIRRSAAEKCGGFYSSMEYDVSRLIAYPGEILELGRSCIDPEYRTGAVMQLLWRGLAAYVFAYKVQLLFGCASLPGTDLAALARPLTYLYYHHLAPPALRPVALPNRYVSMKLMDPSEIDPESGFNALPPMAYLPPLIKGYLRVGGYIGDGAVIDEQFNTTDVCVVVKTDLITEKYSRHYMKREAEGGAS